MEQAGGDRIDKYKRKIGDEYRQLSKMIAKNMLEDTHVKAIAKKEMQNDYSMRTRKRDDKNDKKEVKKVVVEMQ